MQNNNSIDDDDDDDEENTSVEEEDNNDSNNHRRHHHHHHPPPNLVNVTALQAQIVTLQNKVQELQTTLEQMTAKHGRQQAVWRRQKQNAMLTNQKLQAGLTTVCAVRDDLKQQLTVQRAITHEARQQAAQAAAAVRRDETMHRTKDALLDYYRKLSKLTGYQNMGKEIRNLENALAGKKYS
jgi:hypothetical protein